MRRNRNRLPTSPMWTDDDAPAFRRVAMCETHGQHSVETACPKCTAERIEARRAAGAERLRAADVLRSNGAIGGRASAAARVRRCEDCGTETLPLRRLCTPCRIERKKASYRASYRRKGRADRRGTA
jgi:hypothetical protein